MFKKPLSSTKTSAPLRSSDRRKLKQRVVQAYGISPELGDLLVPEGLMSQKVATYTNDPGVVYLSSEGDPLWFTVGKGADDLIPTVYTLWKKFDLLPWISTPAAVIPVLVGGADLMIPGVVQVVSSPTVLPQQLVSIVQHTVGSTLTRGPPLAVGRLAVDLNTLKEGAKGKAVHVLHTWKDHLFDMGSKADPPGEMEIKEDELGGEDTPKSEPAGADERQESVPDVVATDPGGTNGAASNALPPDELQAPASAPKSKPPLRASRQVSDMLRVAVLQAIETKLASLTSASFPIPASTFYSSYILPFRPAVVHKSSSDEQSPPSSYPQIDVKHSSYKSLVAFFKFLDKQRILSLKDIKPEPLVMSVSATHPDVIAHRPYTSLRDVQIKEEKREKREEEERSKVREMEVKESWKPHAASGSARFFTEGGFDSSALYSYSDLKLAVNKYVDARQLTNPRDRLYVNVGTDEVLLSTACAKGEAPENVEFLKREDVVRRLSEKMQRWYEIQAEGKDPVLKKGQLKPISVVVKVRQGRKASTLVVGFEPFFLEGEEMADELRRICACATSVSPAPGRASGLEVLIQGKQIKAVTEFLLSRGVPKKWIESPAGKKSVQIPVVLASLSSSATMTTTAVLFTVPYAGIVAQSIPSCLADSFYGIFGQQAVFKPTDVVCVTRFVQGIDNPPVIVPLPAGDDQLVWIQESAVDNALRTTAYDAQVKDFFQWLHADGTVVPPATDYQTVLFTPEPCQLSPSCTTIPHSDPPSSPSQTPSPPTHSRRFSRATGRPLRSHPPPSHTSPSRTTLSTTIVNGISMDRMRKDIRYLTNEDGTSGIESRNSFANGSRVAAAWLKAQFEDTGASCELKPFLVGFAPNVVCKYAGTLDTESIVLISGHYDSRGSFGSSRAPGGNDDGSGTISLLAIAHRIKELGLKFHTNVELVAFAGEEQGLLGSKAYARELRARDANVTLMIQADMLAYHAPNEPPQLGLPEYIGTPEVAELVTKVAAIYSPELTVGYTAACCSDHQSFHQQGYPATQVFERAGPIADPMYHNSGDVSDRPGYDFNQVRYVSRVQFATLLHAAGFELSEADD
ncbi:hypothetical protein JVT61DRAFT_4685 [Boletus reticuloceps]|uniref:Peptide hydrolase n=1 Tax=Boletus reticuloceps TaxID=495285 RepID=A0A8I3A8Z8_9AGAM|nr:hypothetical protein JVT61DRAFT_4685 [Boletus reticuloceps]